MEVKHQMQNNTLIVTPVGNRIDVIVCPRFKDQALDLIEKYQVKNVIFDLHHVEFIDSAGLVCFLSLWKQLNKGEGSLKFACLTPTVKQIVDLVLLNKVFDIYETVDAAAKKE